MYLVINIKDSPGADPGFQVREVALKKLRRAKGGTKNVGVFRVKKHDFTPKNHILSNCGGRREKFWGISCEKYCFPISGGGRAAPPPPPLDPPLQSVLMVDETGVRRENYRTVASH